MNEPMELEWKDLNSEMAVHRAGEYQVQLFDGDHGWTIDVFRGEEFLVSDLPVCSGLNSFSFAKECAESKAAPILALIAELTSLRAKVAELEGHVVPWRKGGANGGSFPDDDETTRYVLIMRYDESHFPIANWYAEGNAFNGDLCYRWENVSYYLPISDFPLPTEATK